MTHFIGYIRLKKKNYNQIFKSAGQNLYLYSTTPLIALKNIKNQCNIKNNCVACFEIIILVFYIKTTTKVNFKLNHIQLLLINYNNSIWKILPSFLEISMTKYKENTIWILDIMALLSHIFLLKKFMPSINIIICICLKHLIKPKNQYFSLFTTGMRWDTYSKWNNSLGNKNHIVLITY
jgi:hypothetical protein